MALTMVRNMKRWTNIFLVYIALGAVLLIIARGFLPAMGLARVEGELVRSLAQLTPVLLAITAGAVCLIAFNLKRQSRRARKFAEEGAGLDEEFFIVGAIDEPAPPQPQVFPEQSIAYQAEPQSDRNVFSDGLSWEQSPEPDVSAVDESEDWNREIAVAAPMPKPVMENGAENGRGATRLAPAEIAKEFSEGRADYESENGKNVSIDDNTFARYQHLIESPFCTMPTFHQLPPPLPEFTGRSSELAELYAARANRDMRVLNIQGPGGVGKTTLALKLADQLKPHYPDAQFYLDLKGASPQPLSIAEAQSTVIRAYLPTVRLPENEAELDHLYHSALMGKHALLLLDNAVGAQQVAPLVAPYGSI